MLIGVLGTLIARGEDGQVAKLSGPARRHLLAALTARVGRAVPVATLVEDLWGGRPPASAVKTLQSHLVRLRRDLAPVAGGGEIIVTDGSAYRLDTSSLTIDAGRFEQNLHDGTVALSTGDAGAALVHLDAALAWWRGEAYAEFPDAPFAAVERLRLAELLALAHERRIEAALLLGRGASLVGEIESRLAIDPYRERLWEQLMVALYRADRQADALAAYHRARTLLNETLGVEPGPGLRRIEQRVLAQDESLRTGDGRTDVTSDSSGSMSTDAFPTCPYLGLTGYEETDSALFVAREQVTARLVARLGSTGLLVVTGDSGAGKSSVVRAGLVPAVRAGALPGSSDWICSVVRARDLSDVVADARSDLLVVDQAEELFTTDETGRSMSEIDDLLIGALDQGTRVVLVLRADFYGRLGELPRLADRVGLATELVPPMTEDELRRVIVEPARRVGLDVDPELVTEVIADLRGQSGTLPLLSAALLRTWQKRRGTTLSQQAYRESGGVLGAIAAAAEEAYLSVPEICRPEARLLLVRLVARQHGVWSRRPLPRDTVVAGPAALVAPSTLEALATGRILTVSAHDVELVHEALLDHWPRLHHWLEERSAVADLVDWLGSAARSWESGGRDDADLVRGPRLRAVLDWQADNTEDIAPLERDFVNASDVAAQGELLAERERADREARGRRRLRYVAAALAAAVVIAVVGVVVATRERSAQQAAATSADARRLAALSLTAPDLRTSLLLAAAAYRLLPSDDTSGALLSALQRSGTALWRLPLPGPAQFVAIDESNHDLWTMDNTHTVHRFDLDSRRVVASFPARADQTVGLSPDSRQLVVAGRSYYFDTAGDARISVLDASDGNTVSVLPVHTVADGSIPSEAVYTADGRWLAVVEGDPTGHVPSAALAVFDTHDYQRPPRVLPLDAPVRDLAAGRDALAVVTGSGTIEVVAASDLRVVARAVRPELATADRTAATPLMLAMSPDAAHIALTEPGDPALPDVLDTSHLAGAVRPLARLGGNVTSMSFSPTGRLLAVSAADGAVTVFRSTDGAIDVRPLDPSPGQATHLAWSGTADADTGLYAAGADANLVSLDLHQGTRLVTTVGKPGAGPDAFSRYGRRIVSLGATTPADPYRAPVVVTDLETGTSTVTPITVDPSEVQYLTADDSVDRVLLDTQGPDQIMWSNLYELPSGRLLKRFAPDGAPSEHNTDSGVIAPDGTTAVYATAPHTLTVFSLPEGRPMRSFPVHFSGPAADRHWVMAVSFAPDGRLVVSGFDPPPHPSPPGSAPTESIDTSTPADQLFGVVDLRAKRLDGQVDRVGGVNAVPGASASSPDGSRFAIGTGAGTIVVVRTRDFAKLTSVIHAVAGGVTSLAFSSDGSTLVSGGDDGTLAFWDSETLRPIGTPIRSTRTDLWRAWYRSDGSVVGYEPADAEGAFQWFSMPGRADQWLNLACQIAEPTLTKDEWDRYVGGGRPFQSVC